MPNVKEKKERALGGSLHLKGARCRGPKCAAVRRPYKPGVHGQGGRRQGGASDFGRQIREKQKFKLTYGINERNLRQLFDRASRATGSTATTLVELLERRLDNTVYRLGFAPSRASARKLVIQGHIVVNGSLVRSPGYTVSVNDEVKIRPESVSKKLFFELKENLATYDVPSWLALDAGAVTGRVISVPDDPNMPFEINLVVESFSK